MNVLVFLTALKLFAPPPLLQLQPPKNGIPQAPLLKPEVPKPNFFENGTFLPYPLDLAVANYIGYCADELPLLCEEAVEIAKIEEGSKGVGWVLPAGLGFVVGIATATTLAIVLK